MNVPRPLAAGVILGRVTGPPPSQAGCRPPVDSVPNCLLQTKVGSCPDQQGPDQQGPALHPLPLFPNLKLAQSGDLRPSSHSLPSVTLHSPVTPGSALPQGPPPHCRWERHRHPDQDKQHSLGHSLGQMEM
uniref:Uncharacterized protein n=1 Tax=Molossus molossus TaxID=27622 RepID=A0A7J8I8G9_MOLMO|nr:hypothetical protein HJG59_010651 [Molossus molossus]